MLFMQDTITAAPKPGFNRLLLAVPTMADSHSAKFGATNAPTAAANSVVTVPAATNSNAADLNSPVLECYT